MSGLEMRIPPPVYLLLFGAVMWLLATATPTWSWQHPLSLTLGWGLVAIGVGFDLGGLWRFIKARTTINPHRPHTTSALVVEGLYRFTRNPMYLGMLLLLIGWGLVLGSAVALLLPPLFALWLTRVQIVPEERVLGEKFGAPYREYLKRVRRWI
ncbi:methyltransferase family protein [Aestuariirhabdus sp. LZHN29]|uniref:methyltransferase family protein n=1 Tax=Aestuariirhabdus sp. LZHN29 TaxID=3417462 RepID=UPI003CF07DD0